MNSPEILAALIAALVSLVSVIIHYIVTVQTRKHEHQLRMLEQTVVEERLKAELTFKRDEWEAHLTAQERQWQESFQAELRRSLVQESTLELVRLRLKWYGSVWKDLKITSRYEWKRLEDQKASIKQLVENLTAIAHGEIGMIMPDRSRRLLTHFRQGCGAYLRDEITAEELISRAHLLKHSMRSDLGINTYEYDSDLNAVASRLGKVDDWNNNSSLSVANEKSSIT